MTASCGRCSGESDTFVLNAEPSWVVLALVAWSSAWTEAGVSAEMCSCFAPWVTANAASSTTSTMPIGRIERRADRGGDPAPAAQHVRERQRDRGEAEQVRAHLVGEPCARQQRRGSRGACDR